MQKRNRTNNNARSRRGAYTAAVSALVIAIVVVFNLIVGSLPPGTLEFDITGQKTYTISEQSVEYLKTLDKDVSIVVLSQERDLDDRVLKLINNYARLSPRITLKIIDPVLNPTAPETYNAREGNVVVSCAATNKTKLLELRGIDGYQDGLILYDAAAYQYYNQLQAVKLDAEGLLTSAVINVTNEKLNKVHLLTGHDEAELGSSAASYLSRANYETASLNLLKDGSIPDDCELILCYDPRQDLADEELDMLKTYLRTGGNVMLILNETQLGNFNSLLTVYGLEMQSGIIGDKDRYYQALFNQYEIFCIYPMLSAASDITASVATDAFLRLSCGMLQVTPERRDAVVTPFMTTSSNGVLVVDENTSTTGQYIIGATAVETSADEGDTESRLTVIATVDLLSDVVATQVGPTNLDIFMNAVNRNFGEAQTLIIPFKNLNPTPIIVSHPLFWGIIFICVIPLGILGGGLVYWMKRRNR